MPFVQIHTSRVLAPVDRRAFGLAVARIYGACMSADKNIVNVAFAQYEQNDIARYDADGDTAQEMTIVTCDIRAGRSVDVQEELGRRLTAACAEHLGISEARVAVYLNEHPAHEIYRDGGRAPDWSPAEAR
jgi:phenylpyruvate tautomerase PptA (4-oxalocrotonate tautomerase family)